MDVSKAIESRRAFRSLDPVPIPDELIRDLARHAQLAPSCSNNQPWRFIFVRDPERLKEMHTAFTTNNDWIKAASMIVVAYSRKEDDCVIRDREYHLFDTGMAVALLVLRATELGLIAHPIAGFSPKKTREILGIPEEYQVVTWINVGLHSAAISPVLTPKQARDEAERPPRKPFEEFCSIDRYIISSAWPTMAR
jgi:nitroreductase